MKNRPSHTLQGKLILLVGMIALTSLFFFLGNYYLTGILGQKYARLVDQNQLLSQYTSALARCRSSLLNYSNLTSDPGAVEDYQESTGELSAIAAELFEAFPDPYVENLSYLSQSLSQKGQVVVQEARHQNLENARMAFAEFSSAYSLVDKYLLHVQQAVSDVSVQQIHRIGAQQTLALRLMLLLFCGVSGLLTVLVILRIRSVVRPIRHLTEMAHLVMQNVWDLPKWNPLPEDETGVLLTAFYHMVQTIREQIEILKRQQKLEIERKEAERKKLQLEYRNVQLELKALQNQVNPHFLFNCLNMISKQAYIEEAPDTQHTTEAIARYLRSVLDQEEEIVTIQRELQGVQNYLDIQALRFGNRFHYHLDCDPSCSQQMVPFMILQPLVENTFTHGVDCCAHGIHLSCHVEKTENKIKIYVEDNGPGMEEEKVQQLRAMVRDTSGEFPAPGIGLINVFRRMQLYFQDQVEIFVESVPYERTMIGFLIPEDGLHM